MDLCALKSLIQKINEHIGERQLILFGSSSLFASFHSKTPQQIGVETTLDADFFLDPDDEDFRRRIHAIFGREQDYHLAHGYYADFVDLRLAEAFPKGWRERLVPMPGFSNVVALHPMDMAVSKVNATARSRLDLRFARRKTDRGLKDILTLVTLIRAGHIDACQLAEQVFQFNHEPACIVECASVLKEIDSLVATPREKFRR